MARKAILETGYTFTPSTNTIVIPRAIQRERLILITNVTTNTVIYNFSDSNLKANTYTVSTTGGVNTTTVVLNYNTAGMSSTDKLQIIIDEYNEKFTPSEEFQDPVNKFRVSSPQALIDTDFEYGTQITKWENVALTNNRPFVFPSSVGVASISSITMNAGSRTVTVGLTTTASGIATGTPITVQDTYLSVANGNFIIDSTSGIGSTTFTYTGRANNSTTITSLFDSNKTNIFIGSLFTNSVIGGTPTFTNSGIAVTVTTTVPHGLSIGNEIAVVGSSQTSANGSFVVAGITSSQSFTYYAQTAPGGTPTGGNVYVRPQAAFLHRPFDGGVIFSSNGSSNFETAIRQTRRYFRYQSGKGIQISSGTILKPNLQIDSLTSSGTTVTVQTKEQHNIQNVLPGTTITVSGANESAYNGTFAVSSIISFNKFTYTALTTPSASIASGNYSVSVNGWYGATNRLGTFDSQNGIFFEFDGQTLSAVRRNSTYQIAGKVNVTQGSNTVTVTDNTSFPTYFSKQLSIGDYIVIRGQSYRVIDIASDTSMDISPSYRGATASYCVVSKTIDTKYPSSTWNIDKCDGTGPSGFNIDLTKMQMFYIDYSWYGAGFIRWGFRGNTGDIIYCHKIPNNNVNTEAYMRSGNLPARYESQSVPPTTQITTTVNTGDTYVGVASTAGFPSSGTLCIRNAGNYEYVNYTGIGTTAFTGLTRAKAGGAVTVSVAQSSNSATSVGSTTNLQIGQRAIHSFLPDATFITSIDSASTLTLSQAATSAISAGIVTFAPMGLTTPQTFTYSATDPIAVEFAYPTYAPTISHWGTSVIMDGRFDDDKSLIFTYGQVGVTTLAVAGSPGSTRALLAIRVAPSVDNGISAAFGARELINRMQLKLTTLDITTTTANSNMLVRAYLNSTPTTATTWTNAVGNITGIQNSSLAQIADYASVGGATGVQATGGEITAGFFVGSGALSLDLTNVRDLGNCVLGGGGATSGTSIYPDGPDTLTIVATNLSTTQTLAYARLSWTEAQA